MVEDPLLAKHLAHFGINISDCHKTEKSMIEMEIDLNKRFDEWSIIQEEGLELCPIFGPGFTGMSNLGNSCYLNSVMQMLFSIPSFIEAYYQSDKRNQFLQSNNITPSTDLRTQLMKLASGLLSGEYSVFCQNTPEQIGIRPQMFKNSIARNHQEFSSKRQQDAQEFLLFVIEQIEKIHQNEAKSPPSDCFKFEIEQRVQCGSSKMVKYSTRCETHLSLPIIDVPTLNIDEYNKFLLLKQTAEENGDKLESNQVVYQLKNLSDCIVNFTNSVSIEDFFSSAINQKTHATMTNRFKTFPEYLLIHLKKFTLNENWEPKKLDISMEVPDILDLEQFRAKGIQPDEIELPESAEEIGSKAEEQFEFDTKYLQQLIEFGFSTEICKHALYNTRNQGIEQATNWILEHIDDPAVQKPFICPDSSKSHQSQNTLDSVALQNLKDMGIPKQYAELALKLNNNETEPALEWYFTNQHQIDEILQNELHAKEKKPPNNCNLNDGLGRYELIGFISHMGKSTLCGHYVVHLKKRIPAEYFHSESSEDNISNNISDGSPKQSDKWIIFNDNKVAISERPPKQFAYIYLYKRLSSSK
ncbi:Ubiquitin carboxyl-terminal hydrolase 5 [Sarcoptes scabiei]|nr:Ubiquitin carboxyl-terminal hydrolase 5 [Sarcoptes scabiei]